MPQAPLDEFICEPRVQAPLRPRSAVPAAADKALGEEPLFLDEPTDYEGRARKPESPSALDLFADENDLRLRTAWVGTEIRSGAPAHAAVSVRAFPAIRPTVLAGMSLLAVLTALATVRACDVQGLQSLAIWQFLR